MCVSAVSDFQGEVRNSGGIYRDLSPTMEELQDRRSHPILGHPHAAPSEFYTDWLCFSSQVTRSATPKHE